MMQSGFIDKAASYLTTLCGVEPNRRTGSPGNRQATEFFADVVKTFGFEVDATPFDCLDYVSKGATLQSNGQSFEVKVSPYSLGCDVTAELVTASSIDELENSECGGKILLMKGALCIEQLMPKGFVFYNPDRHKRIYALLEEKSPAGIITATKKNPDLVGALFPFPLIFDGDFDIPSVYCSDKVGQAIARKTGDTFRLKIEAERIPSTASNVVARKHPDIDDKIVITAHIDAYENTPGASDNASGVVVLLLLAEMLTDSQARRGIEITALNGEDHYSVAGQMDYLNRYGNDLGSIVVVINVDNVGYRKGRTAYSCYECASDIEHLAENTMRDFDGLVQGEQWPFGDHMIFVQRGVASIALTAEFVSELMATVTHTSQDTPDIIDPEKLVEVAAALTRLVERI
jgi:aminopeptidase YwaD